MNRDQPMLCSVIVVSVGVFLLLGGTIPEVATAMESGELSRGPVTADLELALVSDRSVMIGEEIVIEISGGETRDVGVQLRTEGGEVIDDVEVEIDPNGERRIRFHTQSPAFGAYGGPGEYTVTVTDLTSGRFLGRTPLVTVGEFDHQDVERVVDITHPREVMIGEDITVGVVASEAREVGVQLRKPGGAVVEGVEVELGPNDDRRVWFHTQSPAFGAYGGPGEYTVTVTDLASGRFLGATPLVTVTEFDHQAVTNTLEITYPRRVMIGEDIVIGIAGSEAREVGTQLRTEGGGVIDGAEIELDPNEERRVRFSTQSPAFDVYGGPGEYTVTVTDLASGRFLGATTLITIEEFDPTNPSTTGTESRRRAVTAVTSEPGRAVTTSAAASRTGGGSPVPPTGRTFPLRLLAPGALGLMIGFLLGNAESVEIKTNVLNLFVAFFGASGLVVWDRLGIGAGLFLAVGAVAVIVGVVAGSALRKAGLDT